MKISRMKNTPKFYNRMYENLHGIEAGQVFLPIKRKILIHSLLKFLFLKTIPES